MADVPISSLDTMSGVSGGDFLIINENNNDTKRIDVANFTAVSSFSPMFVEMQIASKSSTLMEPVGTKYVIPGQCGYRDSAGNCTPTLESGGDDERGEVVATDLITKVLSPTGRTPADIGPKPGEEAELFVTEGTFTLPNGADSCLIIMRSTVTAAIGTEAVTGATTPHYGRGLIKYVMSPSEGTMTPGNANNRTVASTTFAGAWPQSAQKGRRYERRDVSKIVNLTGASGSVTMTMTGRAQDTLRYYFLCGRGALAVYPYSSTNPFAVSYANSISEMAWEFEMAPLDASLAAEAIQEDLMNKLLDRINAIYMTKVTGRKQDGSPFDEGPFNTALADLYNLRYTFTGTSGELEEAMDDIVNQLISAIPEVSFRFNLTDVTTYSNFKPGLF